MAGDAPSWAPWEKDLLRSNYHHATVREMSRRLGRTEGAVKIMLHRLGVSKGGDPQQYYLRCAACGFNRHISKAAVHQSRLRDWILVQCRQTMGPGTGFVDVPHKNLTVSQAVRDPRFRQQAVDVLENLVRLGKEAEDVLERG